MTVCAANWTSGMPFDDGNDVDWRARWPPSNNKKLMNFHTPIICNTLKRTHPLLIFIYCYLRLCKSWQNLIRQLLIHLWLRGNLLLGEISCLCYYIMNSIWMNCIANHILWVFNFCLFGSIWQKISEIKAFECNNYIVLRCILSYCIDII